MQLEPLSPSLTSTVKQLFPQQDLIKEWFSSQMQKPPFHASMDIRQSTFKIASCDTNLFPAGWNHIHPSNLKHTIDQLQKAITSGKKLLLIPEAHTSNLGYFENVSALKAALEQAGYTITIGSTIPYLQQKTSIHIPNQISLELHPLNQLDLSSFDATILNHDRIHLAIDNMDLLPQPFYPSPQLGWDRRKKSQHFQYYQSLVNRFSEDFQISPCFFSMHIDQMTPVNFEESKSIEQLKEKTAQLLDQIRQDYQREHIAEEPFVVIKANSGTYGNAVMMIHDPQQLDQLNKKAKSSMRQVKGTIEVQDIILQEGIPSAWTHHGHSAEPVVYTCHGEVIGGFTRSHPQKTKEGNLNSKGMVFTPWEWPSSFQQSPEFFLPWLASQFALAASAKEEQACQ